MVIPDAMPAIQALHAASEKRGVPAATLALIHLRASQINGCSACVESGSAHLKQLAESDERIAAVGAWRDSPRFSEAERAALALAEAVTRLSDRPTRSPTPCGRRLPSTTTRLASPRCSWRSRPPTCSIG